jgi:hypothetical protein
MKDSTTLATRMLRILLQRAEEMIPAVRKTMVTVMCLCTQTKVLLSSFNSHNLRSYKFMPSMYCNPTGEFTWFFMLYNSLVYYIVEGSIEGEKWVGYIAHM